MSPPGALPADRFHSSSAVLVLGIVRAQCTLREVTAISNESIGEKVSKMNRQRNSRLVDFQIFRASPSFFPLFPLLGLQCIGWLSAVLSGALGEGCCRDALLMWCFLTEYLMMLLCACCYTCFDASCRNWRRT